MILRRLTQHLRKHDWLAGALDCLVVSGILTAFQMANWNEAQTEWRLGKGYAVRLITDFEQTGRMGAGS